jgi:putative oxidoreductase
MKTNDILLFLVRLGAALIMLQTLYFKFTGAEESVYIFSTIGMEPFGRIGVGVMELIASVLLLIRPTAWMGALLAIGLMAGALGMHFLFLGIEVMGDGGYLFILALIVLVLSLISLYAQRTIAIQTIRKWIGKNS